MTKVKNISAGPRFIAHAAGTTTLQPGEERDFNFGGAGIPDDVKAMSDFEFDGNSSRSVATIQPESKIVWGGNSGAQPAETIEPGGGEPKQSEQTDTDSSHATDTDDSGGAGSGMSLADALAQLDKANDAHWTQGGKPSLDILQVLTGNADLKRADVDATGVMRA